MGYKTVYREIMRAYEADRDKALAILEQRRGEVYRRIPRLREIETQLTAIGLSLAKQALEDTDGGMLAALRAESLALREERFALLEANHLGADYLTPPYQCAICSDTGFIETGDALPTRCRCLKQRLIDKYYDLSNIKDTLSEENFDTFDLRYYDMQVSEDEGLSPYANMQTIYQTAMQFVLGFGRDFQNLLLYGDTGLGKTFLCNCIAKDLLNAGRTVLYLTAPRLFKVIEDYRFNRDEMEEPDEMLEAVADVDLLILDDLGAEFATVITSAALFDIINQRLINKKPVVISTNLSPPGLQAQYSERIVSRFLGHYKLLKFFGDDIRIRKKYAVRR